MNKIKRKLAMCLMVLVLCTSVEFPTFALEESTTKGDEQAANQESPLNAEDNENDSIGVVQENGQGIVTEQVQEESNIKLVYIENTIVYAPGKQNIAIILKDEGLRISSSTLKYTQLGNNGEILESDASNIVNNTVLFEQDFSEQSMIGTYQLEGLEYVVDGVHISIDLSTENVGKTTYQVKRVNSEDSQLSNEESVTAYTFDEQGNPVEENSIADALIEAEGNANVKGRSGIRRKTLTVALDPGHDATHTGAQAPGLAEETLNLQTALACKAELETYEGVSVYMTRDALGCPYGALVGSNWAMCNQYRINAAKSLNVDVFISLHYNSVAGSSANGSLVLTPNSSYNSEVYQEGMSLSKAILEQLAKLGLDVSRGPVIKNADDGGVYDDGSVMDWYQISRECKILGLTGITVEHAFVTGNADSQKLKDPAFINALGVADATGIANKYGMVKKSTSVPKVGSTKVINKDDFNKKQFTVQLQGVEPVSNIKEVKLKVWSQEGGQDDLKTYVAVDKGNGMYEVDVKVSNHKNTYGEYVSDVYIVDAKGNEGTMAGRAICTMANASATTILKAKDTTEKEFNDITTVSNPPNDLESINTAVWSEEKGQDDLVWYVGSKDGKEWTSNIITAKHKSYGVYYVDTYAELKDGTQTQLNRKTFSITPPKVNSVQVENMNDEKGTFDIVVNGAQVPSGVKSIRIPVWSQNNQSDIRWYVANKQTDETYRVSVAIGNHGYYYGTYYIHTYIDDGNGFTKQASQIEYNVERPKDAFTAKMDDKEQKVTLSVTGLATVNDTKAVEFAVWSEENGQDDLLWYNALNTAGRWSYTMNISNHKTAGAYYIDAYKTHLSGEKTFVGRQQFIVTKASALKVEVGQKNEEKGTFVVTIKGANVPSGIQEVQIPVWSTANQSDIQWYSANKKEDGSYQITVDVKNHKYNFATYYIHAYVFDYNGIRGKVGETTVSMTLPKLSIIATKNKTESIVELKTTGVLPLGNLKKLEYAVWSGKGGQDDLIWYQASKQADTWVATLNTNSHRTAGIYYVDTYAVNEFNIQIFVGRQTFKITEAKAEKIEIVNENDKKGTFTVKIIGAIVPAGIKNIQVPIWAANDQSDIQWYSAVKQQDGSYTVEVNIKNHGYRYGIYQVHAYVLDNNQIQSKIGELTKTILTPIGTVTGIKNSNETVVNLSASDIGIMGGVKGLDFAVWSEENGQDDLQWYSALEREAGMWIQSMNLSTHKTVGNYYIDAYALNTQGQKVFVGRGKFNVTKASSNSLVTDNLNVEKGTFDVVANGVTTPSGIKEVRVAVWCNANQSDIKWYSATKQSQGTYRVTINGNNHNYIVGKYAVHFYAVDENGAQSFLNFKDIVFGYNGLYPIKGQSTFTSQQMVNYYNLTGAIYPSAILGSGGASNIMEFCNIIVDEARKEDIKAEVVFVQSMKETGNLKFGGDVKIEQFNFCGLGATGNGVSGNSFSSVRIGIRAQVQHLKAYANNEPLNETTVDPRFNYVKRGVAPYVEWLGQKENPQGAGWATDPGYGNAIVEVIRKVAVL